MGFYLYNETVGTPEKSEMCAEIWRHIFEFSGVLDDESRDDGSNGSSNSQSYLCCIKLVESLSGRHINYILLVFLFI